jgi:hypothetical protein
MAPAVNKVGEYAVREKRMDSIAEEESVRALTTIVR